MNVVSYQTKGFRSFIRAGFRKQVHVTASDIVYLVTEGETPALFPSDKKPPKQKMTVQLEKRHPYTIDYQSLESPPSLHFTGLPNDFASARDAALFFNLKITLPRFMENTDRGFLPVIPAPDSRFRKDPPRLALLNLERLDYFDLKAGKAMLRGLKEPFKLMKGHEMNGLWADTSFRVVKTPLGRPLFVNDEAVKGVQTLDGVMGFFRRLFIPTRWGKGKNFAMITFKSGRKLCVRKDRSDMPNLAASGHKRNGDLARVLRNSRLATSRKTYAFV